MRDVYGWTLRGVMRHRFLTMLVAAGTLVGHRLSVRRGAQGLHPQPGHRPDHRLHRGPAGHLVRRHGAAPAAGGRRSSRADPEYRRVLVERRAAAAAAASGEHRPPLHPPEAARAERTLTPEQVIEQLRPKLNAIPGIRTYLQNPPLVRIGGQVSRSLYQYTLQAPDIDELYRAAADFEKRMRDVPGLTDVNSDLQISSPQVIVDIDRDRASALGVTADADRKRALQRLRLAPGLQHLHAHRRLPGDPGTAAGIPARSRTRSACSTSGPATGKLVPLNAVAKLRTGRGAR